MTPRTFFALAFTGGSLFWGVLLCALGVVPWDALPFFLGVVGVSLVAIGLVAWGSASGRIPALVALALVLAAMPALADMPAPNPPTESPEVAFALANPFGSFRNFFIAAKEGKLWVAAASLLFGVVGFLRLFGKKLHALIPDDVEPVGFVGTVAYVVEKWLFFAFDTKIGGWVLNWATAIAGCLIMASAAGLEPDAHAWRTALVTSTTGTAAIELKDDLWEWWEASGREKFYRLLNKPPPPRPAVKP